jgi:hypothetical protein
MRFIYLFIASVLISGIFLTSETSAQCVTPSGLSTSQITSTGARLNWSPALADSFLVRYYESGSSVFNYIVVKPGTSTSVVINNLRPNTLYYWAVRTFCNGGMSGSYPITPASFTTLAQTVSCLTPNQTSSSSITNSSATVSWNRYIIADSFVVRYAITGTTNYSYVKQIGTLNSYNISGLLPGSSYTWAVRCVCAGSGTQSYSTTNTFTTTASTTSSCTVPDVTYFSNSNRTASSATVGWRSVSGAQQYNVRYAVRYSGNWQIISATSNSVGLNNLLSSTTYEFQVQTVCASGLSAWSFSGIFTTLASSSTSTITVSRGPYLQQATTTSIYIRWRTNVATNSTVRFGTSATNLSIAANNTTSSTEHIVQLTNLSPNTKYFYSIGSSTSVQAGDTGYYFYTHPNVGSTGPVRIWAIGDFGVGSTAQTLVRDAYMNYARSTNTHTNLWLWLGDNAYVTGLDNEYQTNVFNMYPYQFRKWVCWPTTGNHDLYSANATNQTGAYFDSFTLPKNGEVGGVASNTEAYYSYNYANIHFVCLESTDASFRANGGAQLTWLANDLAANTQRWTIVYFHHPPFTKGSHDSDTEIELMEMRTNVVPILENYKVDLVLSGHSHAFERSYLLRGHYGNENTFNSSTMAVNAGSGAAANPYIKSSPNFYGTVYAVCGVSGKVSGTTSGWPHNAMYYSSVSHYGSMVIDIAGDQLDCKFMSSSGSIRDQFTIQKSGNAPPLSGQFASGLSRQLYPSSPVFDLALFPNPVVYSAAVEFQLEHAANVVLEVYDMNGRVVSNANNGMELPEGLNRIPLPVEAATLPRGLYILRLTAGDWSTTRRFEIQ